MKKLLLCLFSLACITAIAQEEKKITAKPYGFIGFDAIMDTRESVTSRNNHVYLYPKPESPDINGKDTNDKKSYDFGADISRIGLKIGGPDAFGAQTTAQVEADFVGTSGNSSDFALRLRHAFINMKWDKTSLLIGQTWHPFFVTENFPEMVNFVVGAPIHPLARAPQIKYTYKIKDISLLFIMLSQGDFSNKGGAEQVEQANFPEMNFQVKYGSPKNFFAAATFGVKNQKPIEDKNGTTLSADAFTSMQANLSLRYTTNFLTYKVEGVYGGNMTNMVMLGGLARKTSNDTEIEGEYLPIYVDAVWADIATNGKKIQYALFGGVTNNLGTKKESTIDSNETNLTRSPNIAKIYAFAPRVVFKSNHMNIGLELLHTIAAYGSSYTSKSKPINTTSYSNNRITLGVRYNF